MTDAPDGPAEGEAERGTRRSPRGGDSGSPVGSTLSIVLAVIAVIAGFLILRAITDDDDDGGDADHAGLDRDGRQWRGDRARRGQRGRRSGGDHDDRPAGTREDGATVLVANASGVGGSAGAMSTALTADGYTLAAEPANSNLGAPLTASVVYYVDGDPAAQAVATTLGVTMGDVQVGPDADPAADRRRARHVDRAAHARHRHRRQDAGRPHRGTRGVAAGRGRHADDLSGSPTERSAASASARRASVAAASMHQRGSLKGRSSPKRATSEITADAAAGQAVGDVGVAVTGDHDERATRGRGELAHAADDLAVEALLVEVALAGHDGVGRADALRRARRARRRGRTRA